MSVEKAKRSKRIKKRNRLIFRTSILIVLIGATLFAIVSSYQADKSIYREGDPAPNFQLKQVNKNNNLESIQLSDLEGKGVMLNFWGTWCEPCKDEMPHMEALYPEYREKGIEIVAVSLDSTEFVIHPFIDRYDLTFPVVYDRTGEVKDLYKIGPIPSTFFINSEGEIVEVVEGALTLERLEQSFQKILPK